MLRIRRALAFDFDGTLVDTMPLHFEAYRRVLSEVGLSLDWSSFEASVGGKAEVTIPRLLDGRECGLSVAEIHQRKKEELVRVLEDTSVRELGSAQILKSFKGVVPVALVSSGSRRGIDCMLKSLGWTNWFDAIVTGEDVSRGKPDPEPYLLAAARLRAEPSAFLAFEDTDDGLASATAAGMRVVDVRMPLPRRLRWVVKEKRGE